MTIDEHGLRDDYQAGVLSATPGSRERCPSPEMTLSLLRARLSGRKAAKVIDHVSQCGYCAGELKFLLEAIREEDSLIRNTERAFMAGRIKRDGEQDSRDSRAFIRRLGLGGRRLSWGPVSLIAGLTVISLAVLGFLVFRSAETYRSDAGMGVTLVRPVDGEVSRSQLVFKWEAVKEAKAYSFELFDRTLSPVWRTDEIRGTEIVLPGEAVDKLAVQGAYFWIVTAHLPDGENQVSRLEKFRLRD